MGDDGVQKVVLEKAVDKAFEFIVFLLKAAATAFSAERRARELRRRRDRILARLADADQRCRISDAAAARWLHELRTVALEIEAANEAADDVAAGGAVSALPQRLNLAGWVDRIKKRFDLLNLDRRDLRLLPGEASPVAAAAAVASEHFDGETSSLLGTAAIHGRDDEIKTVIAKLTTARARIPIVALTGEGGVGKTAVARRVYCDAAVTAHFSKRVWISGNVDVRRATAEAVEQISGDDCRRRLSSLESLQRRLQQILSGERLLLVLDGVPDSISPQLTAPLPAGSAVLATARGDIGATDIVVIKPLETIDCWRIMCDEGAAGDRTIGMDIAKKCDGLPLAARWVGKALRGVTDGERWRRMLRDMPDPRGMVADIVPVLRLSYELLPLELKHCFRYCAVFPREHRFDADELVRLWLAEGLISGEPERANRTAEDIGRGRLDDLLRRFFFRRCPGDRNHFQMSNAMHELAASLSRFDGLRIDRHGRQHGDGAMPHYALLCFDAGDHREAWKKIFDCDCACLRTLIVSGGPLRSIPELVFTRLKLLRVLDVGGSELEELPESVGFLIHLRYLGLRKTKLRSLPEAVCRLRRLQTLELGECYGLKELPARLADITGLRHLGLHVDWETWDREEDFAAMPAGIGKLMSLQTLSRFAVAEQSGMSELKDLNLTGELCVSRLENVGDAGAAGIAAKTGIKSLMLRWSDGCSQELQIAEAAIGQMQPAAALEELWIEGYSGRTLPYWISSSPFSKMEVLTLAKCRNCERLPPLAGMPGLKKLRLQSLDMVKDHGNSFAGIDIDGARGSFPAGLLALHIADMPNLQRWFRRLDRLPQLAQLTVKNCPVLSSVMVLPSSRRVKVSVHVCPELKLQFTAEDAVMVDIDGAKFDFIGGGGRRKRQREEVSEVD